MSASTTAKPSVLVVGATGQQGGAVVSALMRSPDAPHVLALTRSPSSKKAQAMAAAHKGRLSLVQGDLAQPDAVFKGQPAGSISAVYVVTALVPGKGPGEHELAIPFIDAAVAHGARHIVWSSVDRGGEPRSWENPTDIKHFYEKHNVELHLREIAEGKPDGPTYTILRPVAFMDNLSPGTFCSLFVAMWNQALSPTTKLQLVSVRDIGNFAARALLGPGNSRYRNVAIGLAGDEVTLADAKATFRKVLGMNPPEAWRVLGKGMLWMVGDLGRMFSFFEREGYGVDVQALRKEDPGLLDLEGWLREESGWAKTK